MSVRKPAEDTGFLADFTGHIHRGGLAQGSPSEPPHPGDSVFVAAVPTETMDVGRKGADALPPDR